MFSGINYFHPLLIRLEIIFGFFFHLIVDFSQVKTSFARLVETQFIMRYPRIESNLCGCPISEKHLDPFTMPDVVLDAKKQEVNGRFFRFIHFG